MEAPSDVLARLARVLARRPAAAVALGFAIVAAGAVLGRGLGVDPGNEALFLANDPARPALEEFRRIFASDQLVVAALRGPILTADGLKRVESLRTALAAVPGVAATLAITNVRNLYQEPGMLEAQGIAPYAWLEEGERFDAPYGVTEFAAEVLSEPLFAGNLISKDGRMAAILCEVEGRSVATIAALRAAARRAEADGFDAFVAGSPLMRVDFAETIRRDQALFVPIIAAVLGLLMALLFRQLWGITLPLGIVGGSVATTLGIAALLGKELNAVSSMLTPVVMVVSIAVSVNFLVAYAQARAESPLDARIDSVARAIGRVGLPCLLTTATNAAGFGSLAASSVPAIADFGAMCAIGTGVSYVLAFIFLPPLLALEWRPGPGSIHLRPGRIELVLARLAPLLERRRRLVLALAGGAVLLAAIGISRIRVETDILGQLPRMGDLLRSTRAIDESLAGVNTIEVLLEGPAGAFRTLEGERALLDLERWLERQDGVAKAFSAADMIMRLNEVKRKARALPQDPSTLDYYFGIFERASKLPGGADPLRAYLSKDASRARLTAHLHAMRSSRNAALLRAFADEAARRLPAGLRAISTGDFVLLENMTAELPYAMLGGLLVATVLIITSMGLVFRSLRIAALAAIPASIPILAVYGLMGWSGIWLSVPTAMISSVVLGLAVDSTILFLSRYRQERSAGRPRAEAAALMLRNAGQSVTYSNLTLIFGFAVGLVSRFPPIRDFGLLTSLTIAASYVGALFLLPALIFAARPGSVGGQQEMLA